MKREAKDFLIVPLDVPSIEEGLIIVEELEGLVSFYKVGLELFTREGPKIVEILKEREKKEPKKRERKPHDTDTVKVVCHNCFKSKYQGFLYHKEG